MRRWVGSLFAVIVAACATSTTPNADAQNAREAREAPSWSSLARFSSEEEFLNYLDAVAQAQRQAMLRNRSAAKQDEPDPCDPSIEECPQEEDGIVVTGSRMAAPAPAANAAITNVQTAGVDEGDIVKMIGRFLIVLQDGRLFSVDTGDSASELALVDRANVYRSDGADTWYDEILVHENRIVVTGYNYGENATEYSVFSLSPRGRFTREAVYFLSSDDYYDVENYATRLVEGNLVIYTPLQAAYAGRGVRWPLVRRWLREDEHEAVTTSGRRLFDARDIYRPIQSTLSPTIHTISVCPLGSARAGDELDCRSTAIAGPGAREFYVSNDHIYLWLSHGHEYNSFTSHCGERTPGSFAYAGEAALFQISLADGRPRAMFVRGAPYDQLGMEATGEAFRALAVWIDNRCADHVEDLPLRFFSTPLAAFSTTPRRAPEADFTPLPSPGGRGLENRFTATHLVYGARERWSSYPPRGAQELSGRVVAVPSSNPAAATVLDTPHNIIRVESIGVKAILTGYRREGALSVSVLDLRQTPRLANTLELEGRYESEGRSHAFNASVDADGAGLMGLPTVQLRGGSGRWWWNSEASDVSFMSLDAEGRIAALGELTSNPEAEHPSYSCEVSCVDWYGNSRPIFAHGRIFALSGAELIEGKVKNGRMAERGRVNLTAPLPRARIARR